MKNLLFRLESQQIEAMILMILVTELTDETTISLKIEYEL